MEFFSKAKGTAITMGRGIIAIAIARGVAARPAGLHPHAGLDNGSIAIVIIAVGLGSGYENLHGWVMGVADG